jgi:hypothetical protein
VPNKEIPLSSLRIDKPCSMDWQAMSGDERRRFCAQCQHHVHNLSALTERQIQKLLSTEDRVCGRLAYDAFGRLITQPEHGPLAWLKRKSSTLKLALSSALAALTTVPAHSSEAAPKPAPVQTATEKSAPQTSPAQQPPAQNPPASPKVEKEDEVIELTGFIICEKPKPRLRKKYKK